MVDGAVRIDYERVLARRDALVRRLTNGVRGLLKRGEVQILPGFASFGGPRTLLVDPVSNDIGAGKGVTLTETETLEADHIIIATGSKPLVLQVFQEVAPSRCSRFS